MTAIKLRLTGFALAIVLVAMMIAWAAHASWDRVRQLSDKLTSAQIGSFATADYFQASLQNLDYTLLRYRDRHDQQDRENFLRGWDKLNAWIDVQKPTLTTPKELRILNQIDVAYDFYPPATTNLLIAIDNNPAAEQTNWAAFQKVEDESGRLLGLAVQLV